MKVLRIALLGFALACMTACATTSSKAPIFYKVVVKRGESLAQIAARFDTTWQQIVSDNEISSPYDIKPGMTLNVRPGPAGYLAGTEVPPAVKDGINARRTSESTSKRKGLLFNRSDDSAAAGKMLWPVNGRITSHYGWRRGRLHAGVDIGAETGRSVRAAASGVVSFAGRARGYGKTIIIDHGARRTLYAHLDSIDVDEGDEIKRGHVIGEVGETGHATGPHLHFEVRDRRNRALNPLAYLSQPRGNALLSSR